MACKMDKYGGAEVIVLECDSPKEAEEMIDTLNDYFDKESIGWLADNLDYKPTSNRIAIVLEPLKNSRELRSILVNSFGIDVE